MSVATVDNRQRWCALLAAAGVLSMAMVDATGTSVALPSIQRDMMLSHGAQQWIITLYSLTLAVAIASGGRLADVVGRARMFRIGVALFAAGSLVSGLSVSFPMLLCGRALEGLGNALMSPAAALLATEAFGPAGRGRAMGLYSGLGGIALVTAPVLCGALVQMGNWRWVFFVNLPTAVAVLVLLRAAGPAAASPRSGTFRPAHSLLLAAALGPLVLGLQQSHAWGLTSPLTLSLVTVGALILAVFVLAQARAAEPLVDVRLFANRHVSVDGLALFCVQCTIVGQSAYGAIYLQRVLHFAPMQSGLTMLLFLMPLMVCSPISGKLYDRHGVKLPLVAGLSLATVGFVLESLAVMRMDFVLMMPALVMIGAGLGLSMPPSYADGTAQVDEGHRGLAFGAMDTVRQLGGAVGMAAIGTVVVASERSRIEAIGAAAAPAAGQPPAALDAIMAQAIYGKAEAIQALEQHWPSVASALRASAAQSIAHGYVVCVVFLAVALCAAVLLFRRPLQPPVETTKEPS